MNNFKINLLSEDHKKILSYTVQLDDLDHFFNFLEKSSIPQENLWSIEEEDKTKLHSAIEEFLLSEKTIDFSDQVLLIFLLKEKISISREDIFLLSALESKYKSLEDFILCIKGLLEKHQKILLSSSLQNYTKEFFPLSELKRIYFIKNCH